MNTYAKAIKIQFISYLVRLLHVQHIVMSALAVYIKYSGRMVLASKVQTAALEVLTTSVPPLGCNTRKNLRDTVERNTKNPTMRTYTSLILA